MPEIGSCRKLQKSHYYSFLALETGHSFENAQAELVMRTLP